jgi:hypothetical protein
VVMDSGLTARYLDTYNTPLVMGDVCSYVAQSFGGKGHINSYMCVAEFSTR